MMRSVLGLCAAALISFAADTPRLVYSKSFPGSSPAFVLITVEKDGRFEYKEAMDDQNPQRGQLDPAEAKELFDLAEKLDYFRRPLEAPVKVANMGMKTFRFEGGTDKPTEVKFNYTQDENGRLLGDWFERIIETEQRLFDLERTVRFDKLGVNQALLGFQTSWEKKRIVAPAQFLPMLDRVVKNESYLHMARERATNLAAAIRALQQPKAE